MTTMPETTSPSPFQIRDAAADVGPERHVAHVLHANRHAARARCQHDVADVVGGFRVAAPAHHVLGAAEFHQPAAHVVVARAHRLHHFRDRNVVGLQPVRDPRSPGTAARSRRAAPPRPRPARTAAGSAETSPGGAQFRQAVLAGRVDQRVLEDPADAGGVRAEFRLHALRQRGSTSDRYSSVRERAQ